MHNETAQPQHHLLLLLSLRGLTSQHTPESRAGGHNAHLFDEPLGSTAPACFALLGRGGRDGMSACRGLRDYGRRAVQILRKRGKGRDEPCTADSDTRSQLYRPCSHGKEANERLGRRICAQNDVPIRVVNGRPLVRELVKHVFSSVVAICRDRHMSGSTPYS